MFHYKHINLKFNYIGKNKIKVSAKYFTWRIIVLHHIEQNHALRALSQIEKKVASICSCLDTLQLTPTYH